MNYDCVVHLKRRRYQPRRHACIHTAAGYVSLCGQLDQRHWVRALTYTVESKWIHDPDCDACLAVMRKEKGRRPLS